MHTAKTNYSVKVWSLQSQGLTGEYIYIRNKKTLFPFLDMPVNCSDAKETHSKRYTLKSNEQRVDLVGGHLSSKNHAVYL